MTGYVSTVSPCKVSSKSNLYFDVQIATDVHQSKKVRVMNIKQLEKIIVYREAG